MDFIGNSLIEIKNSLKKLDLKESILEDSIFDLRPEQLSVNEFIR